MSEDYYLVCSEKKIIMPIFTMNIAGYGYTSKHWMFDFILACGGAPIELVHAQSERCPDHHEDDSWTFINAWYPHPDDKEQPK